MPDTTSKTYVNNGGASVSRSGQVQPWQIFGRITIPLWRAWRLCRAVWARLNGYTYGYSEGAIDSRIAPLVAAMNMSGKIRTLGSCEGHFGKGFKPHVYFASSVRTARHLDAILREAYFQVDRPLSLPWTIGGVFCTQHGLRFELCSAPYDRIAYSPMKSLIWLCLNRKRLDRDFAVIAKLVEEELPQRREHFGNRRNNTERIEQRGGS